LRTLGPDLVDLASLGASANQLCERLSLAGKDATTGGLTGVGVAVNEDAVGSKPSACRRKIDLLLEDRSQAAAKSLNHVAEIEKVVLVH
jgi:hypothetical protein